MDPYGFTISRRKLEKLGLCEFAAVVSRGASSQPPLQRGQAWHEEVRSTAADYKVLHQSQRVRDVTLWIVGSVGWEYTVNVARATRILTN